MLKNLLNAMHDAIKWCLHVVLVPFMAVLKAVITGLQHLYDELAKV